MRELDLPCEHEFLLIINMKIISDRIFIFLSAVILLAVGVTYLVGWRSDSGLKAIQVDAVRAGFFWLAIAVFLRYREFVRSELGTLFFCSVYLYVFVVWLPDCGFPWTFNTQFSSGLIVRIGLVLFFVASLIFPFWRWMSVTESLDGQKSCWFLNTCRIAALLAGCFTVFVGIKYCEQPLLEAHGFRQTQTALTAFWFLRDGFELAYKTPVLGAPWSVPFEFPFYQWMTAVLSDLTGLTLSITGRLLSLAFLLLIGIPVWKIGRLLRWPAPAVAVSLALLWTSPLYVFWGRTFMIETAAVFFSLMAVLYAIKTHISKFKYYDYVVGILFAVLALLQKSTTAAPIFLVVGLCLAVRELIFCHGKIKKSAIRLSRTALLFGPGLFITILWNWFADAVKNGGELGAYLTSSNLAHWNFGTVEQRLDLSNWGLILWDRVIRENVAGILGVTVILVFLFFGRQKERFYAIGCLLFLFLFLPLIFFKLHLVHSYYQVASGLFIIIAVAYSLAGISRINRNSAMLSMFLCICIMVSNVIAFYQLYGEFVSEKFNSGNNDVLAVAEVIKNSVNEKHCIVVIGDDWNSRTAFYSERMAITAPDRWVSYREIVEDEKKYAGDTRIGAFVFYLADSDCTRNVKSVNTQMFESGWKTIAETDNFVVFVPPNTTDVSCR